jgi:hypothetical protein
MVGCRASEPFRDRLRRVPVWWFDIASYFGVDHSRILGSPDAVDFAPDLCIEKAQPDQ